jgi:hypothetical protein
MAAPYMFTAILAPAAFRRFYTPYKPNSSRSLLLLHVNAQPVHTLLNYDALHRM